MSMEMSFFTMPLAQTWHAWIWFRTPDTIVFTNHDHVHGLSRQGRPHKDMTADRLKLAHTDRALIRHWLVARAHSLSRHADAPC